MTLTVASAPRSGNVFTSVTSPATSATKSSPSVRCDPSVWLSALAGWVQLVRANTVRIAVADPIVTEGGMVYPALAGSGRGSIDEASGDRVLLQPLLQFVAALLDVDQVIPDGGVLAVF